MTDFPFDIVGFDLDGTLLDTALDLGHALNHALVHIGRPAIPVGEARRFIGGGTGQTLQDVLVDFYATNIARHTRLFPGGEAMLDALAARGVRLAVATNKREDLARCLFGELGLTSRFATIIGGNTLGPGTAKPAPDMLHAMVEQCGGGRAAFVGDTTFDVGAARAAGMPVVAVRFGFCDLPPDELGADAVIDHFGDLLPALEALG
jgi:phosphoglycolate phosphatase